MELSFVDKIINFFAEVVVLQVYEVLKFLFHLVNFWSKKLILELHKVGDPPLQLFRIIAFFALYPMHSSIILTVMGLPTK